MYIMVTVFLIIIGGSLLYTGGNWLVKGASSLALSRGISKLLIGLTIVAFGTSTPELFTSLIAAFKNVPSISIGNVIGSNIVNISLILGLAAVIYPPQAESAATRLQIPFSIAGTGAFLAMILNGALGSVEALGLLLLFAIFFIYCLHSIKDRTQNINIAENSGLKGIWRQLLFIIFGLIFLVGGSELFIRGAVRLAKYSGASQYMIGLTVVAVGTSLPELATSIVAAIKRESDIMVGNIIGSNMFNLFFIMGFVGLLRPFSSINTQIVVDAIIMLGLTVIMLPMLYTGRKLSRPEGSYLLAIYVAYIIYIAMRK